MGPCKKSKFYGRNSVPNLRSTRPSRLQVSTSLESLDCWNVATLDSGCCVKSILHPLQSHLQPETRGLTGP
ncbi:hypothetical protein TcWFU_004951 [Taenia crassiceps]|uniref:Uncharacterized protein n=1 Tax=Taenia crassiceps TaxID=6207 RepID=A0ABR4QR47_9CEST